MLSYYRALAYKLTARQREMLVDHAAKTVIPVLGSRDWSTRGSLLRKKLLYPCTLKGHPTWWRGRMRATRLTEVGRAIAAAMLAKQAEALVAAGCADAAAAPVTIGPMESAEHGDAIRAEGARLRELAAGR